MRNKAPTVVAAALRFAGVLWCDGGMLAVSRGRHVLGDPPYRMRIGVCGAFLIYLAASFVLAGAGLFR